MTTTTKRITDFRVSWTADHEQYYQGHGIAFTDYTHTATGCGETLREAFEDALEDLCQQDSTFADMIGDMNKQTDTLEHEMLTDLTLQVKSPEMLDWDIVKAECPEQGDHVAACAEDCENCGQKEGEYHTAECQSDDTGEQDCSVCAGDWHFYVNVDVKVEGQSA